jgi:hypothetical protein
MKYVKLVSEENVFTLLLINGRFGFCSTFKPGLRRPS